MVIERDEGVTRLQSMTQRELILGLSVMIHCL